MKGFGVVESGKRVGWIKKDIPRPGKFEALARPAAIAPCTSDVHLAGRPAVPEGRILGHEVVAEIVEVGEGVTERKPGDIVAAGATTPDWRTAAVQDNLHQNTGGWKQWRCISSMSVGRTEDKPRWLRAIAPFSF